MDLRNKCIHCVHCLDPEIDPCSFAVLSIDFILPEHNGAFFSFNKEDVDCILGYEYAVDSIFTVWYSGTNSTREVKLRRTSLAGSSYGNAYGSRPSGASTDDWVAGTYITFVGIDVACNCKNYILVPQTMTWSEGEQYCMDNWGTNLASIHNTAENTEAGDLCFPDGIHAVASDCWIGLHNVSNYGWTDGQDFNYDNWYPGQAATATYDCAGIGYIDIYSWRDILCLAERKPLCNRFNPTQAPTVDPTQSPTMITMDPTSYPTINPTLITMDPTTAPTTEPTTETIILLFEVLCSNVTCRLLEMHHCITSQTNTG